MKPNFLIIGAQRAGTTSLYENLVKHPNVIPASIKEIHFFDNNFKSGLDWYESHFSSSQNSKNLEKAITGEASPYYIFHPLVPQRMAKIFPEIKLIALLRNPIDRAFSHYHHEVRLGFEKLSFEEAIKAEKDRLKDQLKMVLDGIYSFNHQHFSYLSRGIYVEQLRKWEKFFSKDQILILNSKDFFNNPKKTFEIVCNFLNLSKWDFKNYQSFSVSKYKKMNDSTRNKLSNYFKLYNDELYRFLKLDFGWE